jgi:Alpha amylase, catalytic domain
MRQHPHLFEISAWPWLTRLSRQTDRLVTLGDVPGAEWDRIAAGGFDYVFLMGVWRRSAVGRMIARTDPALLSEYDRVLPGWTMADVPGSPYCIEAYEPDARMGGWAGVDAARRALAARDLRLILDFVPNHTGFDHPWVTASPDRYVLGTFEDYRRNPDDFRPVERDGDVLFVACGRDPYFAPWRDVAQLNYFNPDTRAALTSTVAEIAAHCDGVRCDMAMLVLNDIFDRTWRRLLGARWPRLTADFWRDLTRGVPSLVYLAEVYWNLEGTMLDQGFSYAYDKRLLDALHGAPHESAGRVRDLLASDRPEPRHLARFLENHDEPRSAATLEGRVGAGAALVSTVPGMRFFYDGQFEGRRVKLPVQLGRWPDESPDAGIRSLYDRLLGAASDAVVHGGEWRLLPVSAAGDDTSSDLVAYRWQDASALSVIVANPGGRTAQGHVALGADVPDAEACDFEDRLTDARYRWTRDTLVAEGLYVRLAPGQAHVFRVVT